MVLIVIGLSLIVIMLMVEWNRQIRYAKKKAYEEGFKKGLYMNVVKLTNGNDMPVVDKYGNVYEG